MTTAKVEWVTLKKIAPQKWTIPSDTNPSQSFKPIAAFKINIVNQRSVLINKKILIISCHNRTLVFPCRHKRLHSMGQFSLLDN